MAAKAMVFECLPALADPGATVFGATLAGVGVTRNLDDASVRIVGCVALFAGTTQAA